MRQFCIVPGRWLLIVAMIAASGGHWIVLQSVAWTTMVIANAKHADIRLAVEKTFDGNHPCPLCKCIEKGRASEKKHDIQIAAGKMTWFYEAPSVALKPPGNLQWQHARDVFAQNRKEPPPHQPPRFTPAFVALS